VRQHQRERSVGVAVDQQVGQPDRRLAVAGVELERLPELALAVLARERAGPADGEVGVARREPVEERLELVGWARRR
jgi:hypothetical protein